MSSSCHDQLISALPCLSYLFLVEVFKLIFPPRVSPVLRITTEYVSEQKFTEVPSEQKRE